MKATLIIIYALFVLTATELGAQNANGEVIMNGYKRDLYPNGKVCREYFIKNGVPNGKVKFFSEKGILLGEQNLVEGIQQGVQKTYYENGKVKTETNMVDGQPQGLLKEYNENGGLKIESNLTGNPWEYSGQTRQFYDNGNLRTESKIAMGKFVSSTGWDIEGRIVSEEKDGQSTTYWYERDTGKRHVIINGKPQD